MFRLYFFFQFRCIHGKIIKKTQGTQITHATGHVCPASRHQTVLSTPTNIFAKHLKYVMKRRPPLEITQDISIPDPVLLCTRSNYYKWTLFTPFIRSFSRIVYLKQPRITGWEGSIVCCDLYCGNRFVAHVFLRHPIQSHVYFFIYCFRFGF